MTAETPSVDHHRDLLDTVTRERDQLRAEVERLQGERAQFDEWANQLRYERRLLGSARMTLDLIFDPENTHQSELQIRLMREEAGRLAQRIVDEIGHAVTDEPALGPEFRAFGQGVQGGRETVRECVQAAVG